MYLFSLLGKAWLIFELPPSVTSPKAFSVTLEIGPACSGSDSVTLDVRAPATLIHKCGRHLAQVLC